jgi:hypothetical protein
MSWHDSVSMYSDLGRDPAPWWLVRRDMDEWVGAMRHCNEIVMVARSERIVFQQNGSNRVHDSKVISHAALSPGSARRSQKS